jgi:hypothetical protein
LSWSGRLACARWAQSARQLCKALDDGRSASSTLRHAVTSMFTWCCQVNMLLGGGEMGKAHLPGRRGAGAIGHTIYRDCDITPSSARPTRYAPHDTTRGDVTHPRQSASEGPRRGLPPIPDICTRRSERIPFGPLRPPPKGEGGQLLVRPMFQDRGASGRRVGVSFGSWWCSEDSVASPPRMCYTRRER